MIDKIWNLSTGEGPIIATAIHNGHFIREDLLKKMIIPEVDRLREEDPFTEQWTLVSETRIVGLRSRFEIDLNRPREKAVYINPEDAWNLDIWKQKPRTKDLEISLASYDAFYLDMYRLLTEFKNRYGHFVVFDLHSYNHMRNGPEGVPAHPDTNPEVNVGTGTMNRAYWGPVVDEFIRSLREFNYFKRQLDVRENVRFQGGYFPLWIHQNFPYSGCALAIEVKKFFMDEWTGNPDLKQLNEITEALRSTLPSVIRVLKTEYTHAHR